ncbi:MAG TPA: VCBS repeat-containing protein [Candidatus Saccharimonadales bacterium]
MTLKRLWWLLKRAAKCIGAGRRARKPLYKSFRGAALVIVLLAMVGSPLFVYLGHAHAVTALMVPSSDVTAQWSPSSGTTHYTLVDDGATDNTANYVQVLSTNTTSSVVDQYTLSGPSGVASASQIVLRIYMQATTNANGGAMDTISMNLIVNGTAQTATVCTPVYNSWTACTGTYTGSWTQADVSSMQVSISRNLAGSGSASKKADTVQVANVYGTLTYVPSLTVTQASYRLFYNQDAAYNGFASKVDNGTGIAPFSVTTGDFNGDGKTDLAVANEGSNTVSILLGNGDGTFQPAVNYTVGTGPSSVATGDFNGDGKTDLAVANDGSNTVSILLGNGSGGFTLASSPATGTGPSSVTTGDFNGDGKTDLAVTNYNGGSGNTVSILLGNGDGTFQPAVNYTVGTSPFSVTTGDFNGDGKTDLAVANDGSGTVSILLGNGDGTFQPKTDYITGSLPHIVTTGDFNGDGKTDLAVTNSYNGAGGNSVSILLNKVATTINVGTTLVAQNTAATTPGDGQPFRLRMDVGISGSTVSANAGSYKLQYAPMTTSCDTSFTNTPSSAYQDITNTSTVRYYDNPNATNGLPLTTNVNDPTDGTNPIVYETYQEKGTTTFTNPNAIPPGSDGMWDFALTTYHTLQNTSYCLRIVNSSGTPLDAYTVVPQINMPASTYSQASYRWFESDANGSSSGPPTTFSYTGAAQSYVVPAGVTSVQVEAWGAQGGPASTTSGGLGGYAQATVPTTPGETLSVYVGGAASSSYGGFNGGGTNAGGTFGGGGGASDVRQGGTALTNRIVVAGGGGGGGDVNGGTGGGSTGGGGDCGVTGGTQTAGGLSGGSSGQGGASAGAGAGGGGYYGGGTGGVDSRCSGGGGSGYVSGTDTSMENGVQSGNGEVIIDPSVVSVGSPIGNQDVVADLRTTSVSIRLRVDIAVSGSGVVAGGQSFKLQYALKSTACSAAAYNDVTATSPIQWYDDVNLTNGSPISSSTDDPTDGTNTIVPQTYQSSSPFSNSSILYAGQDGMWDFNLMMPSGTTRPGTDVCLRVVEDNGTAFSAPDYAAYPELQYGPKMTELMRQGMWFDQNGIKQPYFTGD